MRWLLLGLCACLAACKVVHSTGDGTDGGSTLGLPTAGFLSDSVRISEFSGDAYISVSLSHASDQTVVVTYTTQDGSAIDGSDYQGGQRQIAIVPGELEQPIYIPIISDGVQEQDESFTVRIVALEGATMSRSSIQVIISGQGTPIVNFSNADEAETEAFGSSIMLQLSQPASSFVTVGFTFSGTATAGSDYVFGESASVSFNPGDQYAYLPLSFNDDPIDEPDEWVTFTLTSASNATIGTESVHTRTIIDDDGPPTASFSQFETFVQEGNAGSTAVSTWVVLSAPSAFDVTIPFTLDSASTTATMTEFTLIPSSPLVIPAGQVAVEVPLLVFGDTNVEGAEFVQLQLGQPTNASLGLLQSARFHIMNDDCIGTPGPFQVCLDDVMLGDVALPLDLDTDTSAFCDASDWWNDAEPSSCVIYARSIAIGTTKVHGSRPLVLAAAETINATTLLDLSPAGGLVTPGGSGAGCLGGGSPGSRAGGAGGSFMSLGGDGGGHTGPATAGATAGSILVPPALLRGGCPGGRGDMNTAGAPGAPGGAVYLVAGTKITLQPGAAINASGGRAIAGSQSSAGGNGGGTGGMIYLHAPAITATGAFLAANGGGGSEGGTASGGGTDGTAPNPLTPLVPAAGGSGTSGGNGGAGFAQGSAATAGTSASSNNAGGGGGGGAGYIHTNVPLTGATVSPAPS